MMEQVFSPPLPVAELPTLLPHRPPMVWVDRVAAINERGGVTIVDVTKSKSALYFSEGAIAPHMQIEWIAQSYGFTRAAHLMCGFLGADELPTNCFLIQIQKADFLAPVPKDGAVTVKVECTRSVGAVSFLSGQVFNDRAEKICQASIKIYAGD